MTRIIRLSAWAMLLALVVFTLSPIGLRPHTIINVTADRALAYALAGFLFVIAYPSHWAKIAICLMLAAICLEYGQEFSPTRHAGKMDAFVKCMGALLGVVAARTGWSLAVEARRTGS